MSKFGGIWQACCGYGYQDIMLMNKKIQNYVTLMDPFKHKKGN
jgi:hypothetical protein